MADIRIFLDIPLKIGEEISIRDKQFHYLKNVMRVDVGDLVKCFNNIDGEFFVEILDVKKKELICKVNECIREQSEEKFSDIEVVFCPVKYNRMNFLLEKSVELGVKSFAPILSEYTDNTKVKAEKLSFVAIEASEQCGRINVPQFKDIVKFREFVSKFDFQNRKLFYLDERMGIGQKPVDVFSSMDLNNQSISFLIGPEGGFSKSEFEALEKSEAIGLDLGRLILRSETATTTVLAIVNQFIN